jgi:hypothetical protein
MNIKDKCHFCDNEIYKMSEAFPWIDNWQSENCQFHPASFDVIRLQETGVKAPHLSPLDVSAIVLAMYNLTNKQTRLRKIDDNVISISKKAQRTSRSAAKNMLPHTGTMRRRIYDYIVATGGATDFQLEDYLKGSHQTVSAGRRSLVVDGYLIDSGKTIKNRIGNDCIVWVEAKMKQGVLLG